MRQQIQNYLQAMATRISKTERSDVLELRTTKLFACMDMAKVLLDADRITVDENWKIHIEGGIT